MTTHEGLCSNCDVSIIYGRLIEGIQTINPLWPYCSEECQDGAEVRTALRRQNCGVCDVVIEPHAGLASCPTDDPQLLGAYCSPECYDIAEIKARWSPVIDP